MNGKQINSVDVLSSVIEYMVSHVKSKTGEDISGIPITFKYVFTIPTCSCDDAKRFMSEAAVKVICILLVCVCACVCAFNCKLDNE